MQFEVSKSTFFELNETTKIAMRVEAAVNGSYGADTGSAKSSTFSNNNVMVIGDSEGLQKFRSRQHTNDIKNNTCFVGSSPRRRHLKRLHNAAGQSANFANIYIQRDIENVDSDSFEN